MKSAAAALVALALAAPFPARADGESMTREQFVAYHDYLDALKDPAVQKMKAGKRLPAIAHNFKLPLPKLKEAIRLGEEAGGIEGIGRTTEAAIREAVAGSSLAGKLAEVRLDVADSHVVTYISWKVEKAEALEQEACLLAARAHKAAPISADFKLTGTDPQDPAHKLFDGVITASAAQNIREARIPDFATTRYIKLFEHVKSDHATP